MASPLDDYNAMTVAERKALIRGKRRGPRSAEDHAPAIGPDGPEPLEPDAEGWISSRGVSGFRRGGEVKKTGIYKLHAGEKVLTRRQALYGKRKADG